MSVTIALIPIALAVVAHRAARKDAVAAGRHVMEIQTRMRDRSLLVAALGDLDCAVTDDGPQVQAVHENRVVRFSYDAESILQAQFEDGVDVATAEAFLTDLDDEYARRVQEQVYQRLLERADEQNLTIESESVDADNAIVLTLRIS